MEKEGQWISIKLQNEVAEIKRKIIILKGSRYKRTSIGKSI